MTCCSAQIQTETFESLSFEWQNMIQERLESTFFDQQIWHKVWWSEFGNDFQLKVLAAYSDSGSVELIAPLMVDGNEISLLGSNEFVDYHDFLFKEPSDSICIQLLIEFIHCTGSRFIPHIQASSFTRFIRTTGCQSSPHTRGARWIYPLFKPVQGCLQP